MIPTITYPYEEAHLRAWFDELDADRTGTLAKSEFRKLYAKFDSFGVPSRMQHLEALMRKFTKHYDHISFEEFCVLVTHLVWQ
jgi:Ca2+-binding EF-hand superfamily protein